ncbi:SGNH/GDSL hydrolase family protein [Silvibacterium dinghuense]|uniref:GDSL family lipase n=1 Tax=Silvibacterium dinghuense TaxID=1560006 RepID=A0A4Q1SHH7_9BACT|nr:SGNH/GDSL hydrolase family protein [Silvibacterium dinghuense]RXS97014.1 GDSL family lipase [Silvibacterium dinghuense]GGG95509.1 lipase [Silvibacterium dinghuense]
MTFRGGILLLATLLSASLPPFVQAQQMSLERLASPPALVPLKMSIHGRVLNAPAAGPEAPGFASQWPGIYYQAAFRGAEVFFRVGVAHEILHVVVDHQLPLVLKDPQPGVYAVTGLAKGRHAVDLYIATESQSAPNHFGGFALSAQEKPLSPPKPSRRQIEFIGDSHTVGYGNTSPKQACTADEVWASTDNTQAFGPLTAVHFHADYEVHAISGRGIVRNYNGFAADTLPEAYPYVLFDKKQEALDSTWKPQLIVIALGTNDFSTPLHDGEKWKTRDALHADYEATYLRFLKGLREQNPHAFFLLWATDMANGEIASEEQRVVDRFKALGDPNIAFIPIHHLAFTGCHGHPSIADDRAISDLFVQFVEAHPRIWKGR